MSYMTLVEGFSLFSVGLLRMHDLPRKEEHARTQDAASMNLRKNHDIQSECLVLLCVMLCSAIGFLGLGGGCGVHSSHSTMVGDGSWRIKIPQKLHNQARAQDKDAYAIAI